MRAITVKYLGPANVRGSRLKAYDNAGNKVTIGLPNDVNLEEAKRMAAKALCQKMGWKGALASGTIKGGTVFVFVLSSDVFEV